MQHSSKQHSLTTRNRSFSNEKIVPINNRNGKRLSIPLSDLRHFDYHTSFLIAFIDIVLSFGGNKKIPKKYRDNIVFEVRHNMQQEIGNVICEIDPVFYTRINQYIKELSTSEQTHPLPKDHVFMSLRRLRTDITTLLTLLNYNLPGRCTIEIVKEFYNHSSNQKELEF